VSRFAAEKNLPLAFEAFRAMRAAHPGTRLILAGVGPIAEELKLANQGLVIDRRLDDGELSACYASADIFLFPSTTETFGNVTLEAMASGLAVVAYDYAAARQYIVHGRSGLLAPLDDRIGFIQHAATLACDLARARVLGRHAREAALALRWDAVAQDFEAVLHEAVAQQAFARGRRAAA
jgi:glycosyltransferase involved in cell wall biosynthesis